MAGPMFSKDQLPEEFENAPRFRKKVTTQALRMEGPFVVNTSEGLLSCEDGFLAVDARGYPYPIAADEFELIYEPDEGEPAADNPIARVYQTQDEIDRAVLLEALEAARFRCATAKANLYLHRAGIPDIGEEHDLLRACYAHEAACREFERLLRQGMPTPSYSVIEVAHEVPPEPR
jgi:hypothetical protein